MMVEPVPCVGVVIDVVVHAMAVPLVISPLPYKGQHTLIRRRVEKNRPTVSRPLLAQQKLSFVNHKG